MKPQSFHETEDEVGRKGLLSWLWCKSSSENAVDGRKEGQMFKMSPILKYQKPCESRHIQRL